MFKNWSKYGISVPSGRGGKIKTYCPKCHDSRHDKRDKSLSVNLDEGLFKCHYCGFSGNVCEEEEWEKEARRKEWFNNHPLKRQKKEYRKPKPVAAKVHPVSEKALKWFESRGISKETVEAMKVTEGMEWMPQKDKEANTVQFNYYRNGELINTKFRTGDKCFKMVSGAELLPYNIDGIAGEKECIVTEGEMDALSFFEVGYRNVVSVPNGANANLEWLDDYMEAYFDDKETIYIASDGDTKGEVLRQELLRRFGIERCRVVEYSEGCKDANEVLMKYGQEAAKSLIRDAKEVKVEGIFTVSDFEASMDALYRHGMQKGLTIGHSNFDDICSFETKRLLIVTGIPGHGKSEFIDEIAERMNMRYNWRWAFFSPENTPLCYHASKLTEKFVGKKFGAETMPLKEYEMAKERLEKDFSFISPDDNYKLDNILDKARVLVRRKGIKGLVIDPYNKLENEQGTKNETQYVSIVLDKLANFAKINDVLVVLMAHPTKLHKNSEGIYDPPSLYDISGSANFYNKTDFGIVVHRDRQRDVTMVIVQKVKFRHLGEGGTATFKYNINNGRYVPFNGEAEVKWDNSNHLINQIMDAQEKADKEALLPFDDEDLKPNIDFDNNTASPDTYGLPY